MESSVLVRLSEKQYETTSSTPHILAATVLRHPSGGIDCVGICPNTQEEERNDIVMVFAQQQRMIVLSLFSMFPRFFNVAKVDQCKSPARVREFSLSSTKDSNCDVRQILKRSKDEKEKDTATVK